MPQPRRPIKLQVAAPCNEDWNKMFGDEAVRFCGTCRQNVYNLSAMTDPEVRKLLDGPRPCVRFFQRDDGTVVTRKCSRMLDAARRRLVAVGMGLAPAAFAFWGGVSWLRQILHGSPTMGAPPSREVKGEPAPPVTPPMPEPTMGVPPPPPEPPVYRGPRRLMGKPPLPGKHGPR